jgi:hypothetical protein
VLRGENRHHRAESAFKALALALREACSVESAEGPGKETTNTDIPSSKGRVLVEEMGEAELDAAFGGPSYAAGRAGS